MSNEGNTAQSLSDKKYQYYGSSRMFYSGLAIGSTTAWTTVVWSGTTTGFGLQNNVLSQRMMIIGSGASIIEWSFDGGTTRHGTTFGSEILQFDGINKSGIDIRSNAATQVARIWVW